MTKYKKLDEEKFAELFEQEKVTKLCSDAGFSKNIEKGQFFITLDNVENILYLEVINHPT